MLIQAVSEIQDVGADPCYKLFKLLEQDLVLHYF